MPPKPGSAGAITRQPCAATASITPRYVCWASAQPCSNSTGMPSPATLYAAGRPCTQVRLDDDDGGTSTRHGAQSLTVIDRRARRSR